MNIHEQWNQLNQLYKQQDDIYNGFASQFNISSSSLWVLYAVCESDQPITQSDLCNIWYFPKQTINSAIANLKKEELIVIHPTAENKRRKAIQLTEKGLALCKQTVIPLQEAELRSFSRFTDTERTQFLDLFNRQLEYLKEEATALAE